MNEFFNSLLVGMGHRSTIAKFSTGLDRYVGVLLVVAAATLGMGIFMPIATVENLRGLTGTLAILDAISGLYRLNDIGGAAILTIVAAIWPVYSISIAFDLWYKHPLHEDKFLKTAPRIRFFGRIWYLLALSAVGFVYLVQFDGGGKLHLPIYFLLLSVILQKLCFTRIQGMINRIQFDEKDD